MSGEDHTFVFADLAGFTALTEAHGDERAADIALEFCAEIDRQLPDDAEDLKMIGDACLLRIGDAGEAVVFGLKLTGELARRHGFLDVRVGMHTGGAARRGSDWFGSTINIAARVSAIAGPCEVLLTEATRAAAGALEGVELVDRGTRELRHVASPLRIYIARAGTDAPHEELRVTDPVCHMRLDPQRSAASLEHEGVKFSFCSDTCAAEFARSPERYVRAGEGARG